MAACSECGEEIPPGAGFCPACGARVAAQQTPAGEERKVVTVLFVDLVESTAQAERLDPEDMRGLLSPYFARVREELERYGGTVEKFIGDAVMAAFGAPTAHEDDPERAVRAALAIRDWASAQDELQVRMAVNTGEALVALGADAGAGEGMVSGDVVNTASRLQTAAPVGGILVGETTYRATAGALEYRAVTAVEAKGKREPVPAWEVVGLREQAGRAATPLVGREPELIQLLDALARVREERGPQLVSLVGVPGIGKTRLARELVLAIQADPGSASWLLGRCLPYGDGVSFIALAEMARSVADILTSDSRDEAAAKLRGALEALPGDLDTRWLEAHLRPLVGLERETAQGGEDSFGAWRRFFEALAEPRPLVLVFEDLHWADPGVLDFVDHLVDWASGVPLLVLCTARPELLERRPGWAGGKRNAITITLSPLSNEETGDLVAALLGESELPAGVTERLLSHAGGNPLYAEEYARMLVERGFLVRENGSWRLAQPELPLPESVQGTIAARVDALPADEKAVLQQAAVVGKVFWLGAVAALADTERDSAERLLHALERKEFVRRERRSSVADDVQYTFRHVLVRDVAYGQLPRARRADSHLRTAAWLESVAGAEELAEQLAHHYTCVVELRRVLGEDTAGIAPQAIEAFHQAGERALGSNAFEAARRFFAAELDLRAVNDPGRSHALLGLGKAHSHAEGGGIDELEQAYEAFEAAGDRETAAEVASELGPLLWSRGDTEPANRWLNRAAELVSDLPPSLTKAEVLSRLASLRSVQDEAEETIVLASAALELAEQVGSDDVRARALGALANARTQTGDWSGFDDYELSIEIATKLKSPNAILNLINYAGSLIAFGDLEGAFERQARGRELARELGEGRYTAWLHAEQVTENYWRGHWDEALRLADEIVSAAAGGATAYMAIPARLTRARIMFDRGHERLAIEDVEYALSRALEIADLQVVVPALALRARLRESDRGAAEADVFDALARIRGKEVWASSAWADLGVVLADLEIPFPEIDASSAWIEAARSLAHEPVAAAELYGQIGSRPDAAYAQLRAARLLVAEGETEAAEAQVATARDFYFSVEAAARLVAAEALLSSA